MDEDACMPIAVIGMGCRFPGDAVSPDHLWEMLENGRSAWSEFPKDRINIDGFYHPSGDRQGSICFRGGHFLRDDIAAFDAPFFSTTAHEAAAMDPQQRMLLEVSYEAFENAGIPMETLPRSSTAVYCGSFVKDYEQICLRDPDDSPQYAATGNGIAIMSNRVSWFYDLRGPSMTLDTGCSASLVGVHLACQSLRAGESTMALAMGAGLILTPSTMLPMTALNFLSPDGKCFAFDERANGYGRGEGIGAIILKPLATALRDNDTIRAIIRGSGVNQDGRTPGITMPSKEAQAINIRAVYKAAGLNYDRTAYFEAHGTGTQAGDPTELGAISETFAETRPTDEPIYVGSVKTNIGHLEGCAGIAGIIKGVLMLEKGLIPTNLYFENVNPRIPMEEWKIKVPKALTPWPMDGLRRVSVNCFGFGGTNAHIILDDARHYLSERHLSGNHSSVELSLPVSPATSESWTELATSSTHTPTSEKTITSQQQIYVLSAHEEGGVTRLASIYTTYMSKHKVEQIFGGDISRIGPDLAYTLGMRRSKLPWKAFVVSSSPEDLSVQLLDGLSKPLRSSSAETPVITFAFSGQGAQWATMGCELLRFHTFRESLTTAETFLHTLGCGWSLIDELLKDGDCSSIDLPRISQPLCTALQVALIDLLTFWDIKPDYVIGHSSGEIAAAYAFGAISREDAWKLSYHRGWLTSAMKDLAPSLKGCMLAVALSEKRVQDYLAMLKKGTAIVACINSPESVTVSGDESAVLELEKILSYEGIFARLLKVDNAYHSAHMKTIEHYYQKSIQDIPTKKSTEGRVMFSSVTGQSIGADSLGPSYWVQNLVSPVRFSEAFSSLLQYRRSKVDAVLEVGPHNVLQGPINQIIDAKLKSKSRPSYFSMITRGKDSSSTSMQAAGHLWSLGVPVDLGKVNEIDTKVKPRVLTDLPTFPWNHEKTYWHESHIGAAHRFRKHGRQDLIGAITADSIPDEPRWRGFIRVSENPWVEDHQVQNTIIYPAAGMIVMALEAARQVQDEDCEVDGYEVCKMHIEKAMIVPTTAHGLETALNAKIHHSKTHIFGRQKVLDFTIYSKPLQGAWVEHARGSVVIRYKTTDMTTMDIENERLATLGYHKIYSSLEQSCVEFIPPRQLYDSLESIGMKYGPTFQNIISIQKKDNSSISTLRVPDTASRMPVKFEYPHLIHPATLDAMFQTVFVASNEAMVPSYLESLYISADFPQGAGKQLRGYSRASRRGLRDALGNIVMSNSSWARPLLIVKNLQFTALSGGPSNDSEIGFLPYNHKLCAELKWDENVSTTTVTSFQKWLELLAFKNLDLSILEVNTGGPLFMIQILKAIEVSSDSTPKAARYQVAGGDPGKFEAAQEKLQSWSRHMIWKSFDATQDILKQGFKANQFDVVLFPKGTNFPTTLKGLLKAGGYLLEFDHCGIRNGPEVFLEVDLAHCTIHQNQCSLPPAVQDAEIADMSLDVPPRTGRFDINILSDMQQVTSLIAREAVFILPTESPESLKSLVLKLTEALLLIGITSTISGFSEAHENFAGKLCISLLEIDVPVIFSMTEEHFDAFRSMIKFAKSCLWVTRGGHIDCKSPFSSPASTLCRTIRSEDPQKLLYNLDLDTASAIGSNATGRAIMSVILKSFQSGNPSDEMEYAERGGKLFIPRLHLQEQLSARIERGDSQPEPEPLPFFQADRPLQLEIGTLGNLDSLSFNDHTQIELPLGSHDVEIEVRGIDVKTSDIKTVLGQTSNETLGTDVSGIIRRIGDKAIKYKVGDKVVALVPGAYKSVVRVPESMCQLIPSGMCLEIAASLSGNLVLAYYCLSIVGRLQKGEYVLIHDAANAFGQLVIQMARNIGAHIFATFSGSDEKITLLETCKIPETHACHVESAHLNPIINQLTSGHGVDLVLNTLSREQLQYTWASVSSFGRFIELGDGKVNDLVDASSSHNLANIIYSKADLGAIVKNIPLASRLLSSAFKLVRNGSIQSPVIHITRPVSEITQAFRDIQSGKSVVLQMNGSDIVPVIPRDAYPLRLKADATYVLVGGLGGLGRSIAGLMIRHGARNLAFFSRSGAVSEDQVHFIDGLAQQGVTGRVYKCDVCVKLQLDEAIRRCEKEMPRIRGVIQGAAVIKDAIFDNMTYEDWTTATRPKMQGSWNLHESMPEDLDFFVFLSSSAAVIGARGQANYASGNAFQDALTHYRRGKGQKAVSLDLGPILGVGMVAEDDATADILRTGGFFGVREQDFYLLMSAAMTNYTSDGTRVPAQVIIATGTGGLVKQNQIQDPYWYREARFSHMKFVDLPSTSSSPDEVGMQDMLVACTTMDEAKTTVLEGLKLLLAKSMNMLPGDLDTRKAASAYGVDSLVAVGTRNWIFRETGVDVSVFEILSQVAIEELAGQIAGKSKFVAVELKESDDDGSED